MVQRNKGILAVFHSENSFTHDFRSDTIQKIQDLAGKEGTPKAYVNKLFGLKMEDSQTVDPTVLRVYELKQFQEMLQKIY